MGQTSSAPSDRWPYFLVFETDSLSKNVITCDELGIRYRVHTPPRTHIFGDDRVTSIYRWDRETQREIHVAEVEKRRHSGRMRIAPGIGLDALGPDVPFVLVREYFPTTGNWSRRKRIFRANNGREYIWKMQDRTIKLYPSDDKTYPIAKLTHSNILDELVVTCLIAERKRREQSRNSSAAAAGAAGGGGGC
ncbi:hypothetical protein ACEPAG_3489 [Sanghuangporus baumii]